VADLGVRRTLRKMRRDAGGSIESLSKDDPQRRKFAMLHGASMLLLLVQIICAALALTALALAA
jgi:hypothetical protein